MATLVKRRTSSNPFEVSLVSSRPTPGEGPTERGAVTKRRFVFDVVSKMHRQRYEIDAYNYETARNGLLHAVEFNLRNVDDGEVSTHYNERNSSAVATAAIVTIAAGTLAVAWMVRRAYAWFTEEEEG